MIPNRLQTLRSPSIIEMMVALASEKFPSNDSPVPQGSLVALADSHTYYGSDEYTFQLLLTIDCKHLYGIRIWDLFNYCGQDVSRFNYHVGVELPDQETGAWFLPRDPQFQTKKFVAARQFGQPDTFWALENPPLNGNYNFPITE